MTLRPLLYSLTLSCALTWRHGFLHGLAVGVQMAYETWRLLQAESPEC